MSLQLSKIMNPGIGGLTPYQPGKPIAELQRETGIQDIIKLASNENPLGPSPKAKEALRGMSVDFHYYPDGSGYLLKEKLAAHCKVQMNQITLGNGSDDIFNFVLRAFAGPGRQVVLSQFAFAAYAVASKAVGAEIVWVPAVEWGHDLKAMHAAITDRTRVVFIANPNNPTGTWNGRDALKNFLKQVPENVIVVVDQAYFEYMEDSDYPNALDDLGQYPNLIVTFTFSKAYGLAGLRIGYSVSSPEIADILNRIRLPFNVNTHGLLAAEAALDDHEHLKKTIQNNSHGIKQYQEAFSKLGLQWIPGAGNFMTVQVGPQAGAVYQAMLLQGVIVRPLGPYGMTEHLRITVGLERENARCIQVLTNVLESMKS